MSRKPAIRGVRKTPSRFDAEALHIAAGTLPPATDVKAIEDCTVEGSAASKIKPAHSVSGSKPGASQRAETASSGNSTNVLRNTIVCSRQCRAPTSASLGRKLRPVHEKQQRDGGFRQPAEGRCRLATDRHHGGEGNRQQDGREELVEVGPDRAEQSHFKPH